MWTFTYRGAGQHDRRQAVRDWHAFVLRLRGAGIVTPWARVLELHPGGHGWHVHAGVPGFLDHRTIERLWGQGFVLVRKPPRRKVSQREGYRRTSRYLSKYLGKSDETPAGAHSYEIAQGYQPEVVHVEHPTAAPLIELAARMLGQPSYVWSSSGEPEWCGPPAVFLSC